MYVYLLLVVHSQYSDCIGCDNQTLIPDGGRDFLFHHMYSRPGAHSASFPMGSGVLSREVKQLGHRADHSLLSGVDMKHVWSYPSIPLYACVAQ